MSKQLRSIHGACPSPFGELLLIFNGDTLTGLYLPQHAGGPAPAPEPGSRRDDLAFRAVRDQLRAYFAGELRDFDIPFHLHGTEFQRLVWNELSRIPFGSTISYAEQARRIGRPGAARAVGAANGRNPISIIVPCHRVIGANGSLTGYGGGLDRKQWLLDHEVALTAQGKRTLAFKQKSASFMTTE